MDYFRIALMAVFDICNQFMVRDVLYQFLMGNTSKKKFRKIKESPKSFRDKVTLSYIRAYIKSDSEKKAFDRYYAYNLFSMIMIPVKLIAAIAALQMRIPFKYVILAYAFTVLIKVFVWAHERNPLTKFTPHAGRKYNKR